MSKEMENLRKDVYKFQCVYEEPQKDYLEDHLELLSYTRQGFVEMITVKGERKVICEVIEERQPLKYEELPLSLEEVFVGEMERIGYDISKYSSELIK